MAEGGRETIIFLDKNRIFIHDGNGILKLDIPENIIRDIDIIDKSGFDSLIDAFIKTKKLDSVQVWLVLMDGICFSKDIVQTDAIKVENDTKDFLEAIPFDKVISKKYRAGGVIKIIAANLEYVEAVMEIFEKEGFLIEGVVPGAMFPNGSTKKSPDTDYAKYILDNKNLMRTGNMLAKVSLPVNQPNTTEAPKKSRLLPFLIGGFVILLIILIVVITTRS
jgi:hypothetical protein